MKKIIITLLLLTFVFSISYTSFASTGLSDVDGTKYEEAVGELMKLGIIDGYPEGKFYPENVLKRNEMTKLIIHAYGMTNDDVETYYNSMTSGDVYTDVDGNWAMKYIYVGSDLNLVSGYSDGTFRPNEEATYGDAIQWCLNILYRKNVIKSNSKDLITSLNLLNNITYSSETESITRGNASIMLWNTINIIKKNSIKILRICFRSC